MASNKIKITTSDDWEVIQYEDFKVDGHRLYTGDFAELLRYLGYNVEEQEVTDEEMEEMY